MIKVVQPIYPFCYKSLNGKAKQRWAACACALDPVWSHRHRSSYIFGAPGGVIMPANSSIHVGATQNGNRLVLKCFLFAITGLRTLIDFFLTLFAEVLLITLV